MTAVTLGGLGALKLFLPPLLLWAMIGAALLVAAAPIAGVVVSRVRRLDFRILLPWAGFALCVLLALLTNEMAAPERAFSLVSIAKYGALAGVLVLLIGMRMTAEDLECLFTCALVVGVIGFAISLSNNAWLLQYGDGRLAWVWAWPGLFWKLGIYVLPFLIWKMLAASSWRDFTTMTLAATVVALDGSRTGLVAVIAVLSLMALFSIRNGQADKWWFRLGLCLLSVILAYALIRPMLAHLIGLGAGGRIAVLVCLLCLVLPTFQSQLLGRRHRSLPLFAGLATIVVATLFLPNGASPAVQADPVVALDRIAAPMVALDRIAAVDTTRMQMIWRGLHGAIEHFPLGGGLGTATSEDGGQQVHIHMTYLQLLSDIGILGVAAYLAIFAVGLSWYWRLDRNYRLQLLPVAAIPAIYLLQGMFAPMSNELTEWLPVLLAFSVLHSPRLSTPSSEDERQGA